MKKIPHQTDVGFIFVKKQHPVISPPLRLPSPDLVISGVFSFLGLFHYCVSLVAGKVWLEKSKYS